MVLQKKKFPNTLYHYSPGKCILKPQFYIIIDSGGGRWSGRNLRKAGEHVQYLERLHLCMAYDRRDM